MAEMVTNGSGLSAYHLMSRLEGQTCSCVRVIFVCAIRRRTLSWPAEKTQIGIPSCMWGMSMLIILVGDPPCWDCDFWNAAAPLTSGTISFSFTSSVADFWTICEGVGRSEVYGHGLCWRSDHRKWCWRTRRSESPLSHQHNNEKFWLCIKLQYLVCCHFWKSGNTQYSKRYYIPTSEVEFN